MLRTYRRLLVLLVLLLVTLVLAATAYRLGMRHLEGEERDFWSAFEWASETLTTTGYGRDNHWNHPLMVLLVTGLQFFGLVVSIAIIPVVLIPWFESRFEARLSRQLPALEQFVLVYRWGPAVSSLVRDMGRQSIPVVIVEENETRARWLRDHDLEVVFVNLEEGQFDLSGIERCRAIIAAGADHDNASLISAARQRSFAGPVFALVDNPRHRRPILLAGADAVYSPVHSLAAGLAAKASDRIAARVSGIQLLDGEVELAELRVTPDSPLAGKTLAELQLRSKTGATIVGQWAIGEFLGQPHPHSKLAPGAIIVALGGPPALAKLGELATSLDRSGPLLVLGFGELGQKLVEMLESVGETVEVVARDPHPRLDLCGDALEPEILEAVGLKKARAAILAFSDDSTTLFAATMLRDLMPNLPIIAAVDRAENVARIHRAGADFALSISQVTAQLLGHKLFGEQFIAVEPRIRVFEASGEPFVGQTLAAAKIPERSGCTVVALGRARKVVAELRADSLISHGDTLYLVGAGDAVGRFFTEFPTARIE
ncbi:potassium channel family protein [Nannocystaceae bacterium ST9]